MHRLLTVNDGLTINEVTDVYQDKGLGYLWIATQNGLNQYNGHSNRKLFVPIRDRLHSNYINSITEDGEGRIWLATKRGLECYDYYKEKWMELGNDFREGYYKTILAYNDSMIIGIKGMATFFSIKYGTDFLIDEVNLEEFKIVYDIELIGKQIFLATDIGLVAFNSQTQKGEKYKNSPFYINRELCYLEEDSALWLRTYELWYRIPFKGKSLDFTAMKNGEDYLRGVKNISTINFREDTYWGTTETGIYKIKKGSNGSAGNPVKVKVPNLSIHKTCFDNSGNFWGGTWESGVIVIPQNKSAFLTYKEDKKAKNGLPSRIVRGFCEINDQEIGIATDRGGLAIYDRIKKVIVKPPELEIENNSDAYSVKGDIMHVIKKDWKGRIWGGYHMFGFNVVYGKDKQKLNRSIEAVLKQIKTPICDDFLFDSIQSRVFIMLSNKVVEFKDKTGQFEVIQTGLDHLTKMLMDHRGNIWLSSHSGLRIYDRQFKAQHVFMDQDLIKTGLYSNNVSTLFEDSKGNVWIGSYGKGLYKVNKEQNSIKQIQTDDYNDFRIVFSIVEDDRGKLWLGTGSGLFSYDPDKELLNRYTVLDGIQDNQFNINAALKLKDGTLLFGGSQGFSMFDPLEITPASVLPTPVFGGLRIGDSFTSLYENRELIQEIEIPFLNNSFEFSFFTQDFHSPSSYVYSYKLNGYSAKEQYCAPDRPLASFTNVPPGTYQLEVKVTKPHTRWSETLFSPEIIVMNPWYSTQLAFVIYAISLILIFLLAITLTRQRFNLKNSLHIAQIEKDNTEKVSAAKLRFFADIAHEIRTPLTLISGPINDLIAKRKFDSATQNTLGLVQQSANRLKQLMDELLMFRKAESGKLPLVLREASLNDFIIEICNYYKAEATSRHVNLYFPENKKEIRKVFDRQKLEKVLSNLLNNALKFTPEEGKVEVEYEAKGEGFVFRVMDTGKGMSEGELEQIFDRFYQTNNYQTGFGIGLTLVKRIVDAHGGDIHVKSKEDIGSVIEVIIPGLEINELQEPESGTQAGESKEAIITQNLPEKRLGTVLVVEDDRDVRNYILGILETSFKVLQAENGVQGLTLAQEKLPDIVVSDNQMPQMDGISMCKHLKSDLVTSHIPVILLSAFNEIEDQLKGLQVGADDYVGKPFDAEVLHQKIINMIHARRQLIETFRKDGKLDLKSLQTQDQRLVEKINTVILREMKNEGFDVPQMCKLLGIGKTTLNEKLHALLGISPAEYIRKKKLKEAYRMLSEKDINVSEVAYAIGFSPAYFSVVFKKEFGVSPKEV